MKKLSLLLALILLLGLAACGRQEPEALPAEESPVQLETLTVEISKGGLGTQQLAAAVKELPEVLRDYFAATGAVEIGEVSVTVGSSASATAQALAEGHIDLAFLPAEAFLRDGGGAVALLADAQQPQPDDDFRMAGTTAAIRAGVTPYGGQLAARSTGSAALTWEELKNARWGVSKTGAAETCFDLWLSANFEGARVTDLPQVTLYEDDAALLDAALAGEIDALAVRQEGWAQEADAGTEKALPMLAETETLCTQLAAVAQREELTQERFAVALEQVLLRMEEEKPELMEALGAARFAPVEEQDLDSARRLLTLEDN